MNNIDYNKIVMLGSGAVGKSSITTQFVKNYFLNEYDPTIEDIYRSFYNVNGNNVPLEIIDTAGQEEYSALRDQYIRAGEAFILVFSITSKTSILEIRELKEQVYRVLGKDDNEHVPMILVGNKCDLENERDVDKTEAEELAKEWGIEYIEASAKTKTNIEEIYKILITDLLKTKNVNINHSQEEG